MKFGLLIDTDLLKTVVSPNPTLKVKFRSSGCHLENRYNIIYPLKTVRFDEIWQPNAD